VALIPRFRSREAKGVVENRLSAKVAFLWQTCSSACVRRADLARPGGILL